ncbi:DUF4143 domain-containing protein [Actinomyces massiliensis]|jgi:hypothetical protein|uniref:DUF4143 domain-containing protein n=1 Tax=Actinomyces massiliensis TaxID=461393 RepID=UPI0028E58588|nr:DUF4143 domain-containing protein [Actinomyces massiliensis]
MPLPQYRRRALESTFAEHASHKVAILEGRRAVGKSSLARHLTDVGPYASYQSLTDPAVAERAKRDASRWVSSLRRPAVIDEAQMVPAVSVAIKTLVDTLPQGHHFLLTGSASVGRGTMAGSDPLVGRATRITLHPFTSLEMAGPLDSSTPDLIDLLFDSPLTSAQASPTMTTDLRRRLEIGGLPALALPLVPHSRAAWQNQIRADTLAILGDQILPTETLDTGTARKVLDSVLRTPGGQINRTRIGQELDLDARTVDRYLGILQRRFLITLLPNLRGGPTHADRRAPKGHAADTSSTCESLIRAGHDIAGVPELMGQTLETWVVNQILAAQGWAKTSTEAFYWRDNKTGREVDLVLVDGRGRHLGIEVKLASSIGPRDLRGLRAMREHSGLHRGFIVYTGADAAEIDDGVWTLPLTCLTSREELIRIFTDNDSTHPSPTFISSISPYISNKEINTVSTSSTMPQPSVFVSYVHDDNKYYQGGLLDFAEEVKEACSHKGFDIELITDMNTLQWGDDWNNKLQEQVERTTFLIAMVTHRYLTSEACQKEFIHFRTKTEAAGYNGLLTLLIDEPDWDLPDLRENPTVQVIRQTIEQYHWLRPEIPFEDMEPGSLQFKKAARKVGYELVNRIKKRNAENAESPATSTSKISQDNQDEADDDPGLIELADTIQKNHLPIFQERTRTFEEAMRSFGAAMTKEFALVPNSSPPSTTQVKQIAKRLEPSRQALDSATSSFSEAWNDLDKDIRSLVRITGEAGADRIVKEMKESLEDLAASMDMPGTDAMAAQIKVFTSFSRALRPIAETMTKTLSVMDAIKKSASAWAEEL